MGLQTLQDIMVKELIKVTMLNKIHMTFLIVVLTSFAPVPEWLGIAMVMLTNWLGTLLFLTGLLFMIIRLVIIYKGQILHDIDDAKIITTVELGLFITTTLFWALDNFPPNILLNSAYFEALTNREYSTQVQASTRHRGFLASFLRMTVH